MNRRMRQVVWRLAVLCIVVILVAQGILFYRIERRIGYLESNAEWRTDKLKGIMAEQGKLNRRFAGIEKTLNQNRDKAVSGK